MKKRVVSNIVYISFVMLLVLALLLSGFSLIRKSHYLSKAEKTILQNETDIKTKDEKIADLEKQLTDAETEKDKLQEENGSLKKENGNLKKEIETLKAQRQGSTKPVGTSSGRKVCYLTFDDGPTARTLEILKILKNYNVKATFFVINTSNIDYIKQATTDGHTIGLHAYNHDYASIYKSTTAYFNDLQKISDKVYSVTGKRSTVIRFPGGSSNTTSIKHCAGIMTALTKQVVDKGYSYFDWNVDSMDAGGAGSSTAIINNVLKNSNGGPICVLMHDAAAKTSTVQALPKIIEGLKERGYTFEPLTDKVTGFHHGINN